MKIYIDATQFINQRGYGRHARALFTSLLQLDSENQYVFYVDYRENLDQLPANASWRYVPTSRPTSQAARANGSRSINDLFMMSRALSAPGVDVLVFPTVYSFVPVRTPAYKILFIHDVIPETYPGLVFPQTGSRWLWRAKSWTAIRQANLILTVSEYSKHGLVERLRIHPDRIGVVGEAPDEIFRPLDAPPNLAGLLKRGIDPEKRIIAYVGGFGPHKNVSSLLSAVQELVCQSGYDDIQLVLVGEDRAETFHTEVELLKEFVSKNLVGSAVFTGFLADEQLVELLNIACVLVLPSWMEGYGLPAVEAAACGCPVIATLHSPLPVILADSALYFEPADTSALLSHLVAVLQSSETRQEMRRAGLQAVSNLSWRAAASQFLDVLQSRVQVGSPT